MTEDQFPPEFLARLKAITALRPRRVIEHILKYGHVTTEELRRDYGYNHPPRAAMDVADHGIPTETFYVKDSTGRRIAAYRFGDPEKLRAGRAGRRALGQKVKQALFAASEGRCGVCLQIFDATFLQVDHRVPYEIGGEVPDGGANADTLMLLCRACNRAKSWCCEHCPNWHNGKDVETCKSCYWSAPSAYTHVATALIRRLDIVWRAEEVAVFDQLAEEAAEHADSLPAYVKSVLHKALQDAVE